MNKTTPEQARAAKPRAAEQCGRLAELAGVGITRVGDGYARKVNLVRALARDEIQPRDRRPGPGGQTRGLPLRWATGAG